MAMARMQGKAKRSLLASLNEKSLQVMKLETKASEALTMAVEPAVIQLGNTHAISAPPRFIMQAKSYH